MSWEVFIEIFKLIKLKLIDNANTARSVGKFMKKSSLEQNSNLHIAEGG